MTLQAEAEKAIKSYGNLKPIEIKSYTNDELELYLGNLNDLFKLDLNQLKKMSRYEAVIQIAEWLTRADYTADAVEDIRKNLRQNQAEIEQDLQKINQTRQQITDLVNRAKDKKDELDPDTRQSLLTLVNVLNLDYGNEWVTLNSLKELINKINQLLDVGLPAWRLELKTLKKVYLIPRK